MVRPASRQSAAPSPAIAPASLLQRKCACGGAAGASSECTSCRGKRLSQRRAADGAALPQSLPPIVHEVLGGPAQSLNPEASDAMGARFGHDFSRVRIHTDARAAASANAVSALAYTVGHDVVFAAGQYAPSTGAGRLLLAHELAHVVQQSSIDDVQAADERHLEAEADRAAAAATTDAVAPRVNSAVRPMLLRQPATAPSPPPVAPNASQQQIIEDARGAASMRTQIALHNLRGAVPPGAPGHGDTGEAMRERARHLARLMFDWPNPNMDQVDEIVGSMVTHLAPGTDVKIGAAGDADCGDRAGYVRGLAPPIVLCPAFFREAPDRSEQQIRTMIHEAAHLARVGTSDLSESYCVAFTCEEGCGGFDSADSWAQFVHCLSGQTPDQAEGIVGQRPSGVRAAPEETASKRLDYAGIADRLFAAMDIWGTDEEAVYRALQELDRDPTAITELKRVYEARHRTPLLEEIHDEFSGDELEFALQLLNLGDINSKQRIAEEAFISSDVRTASRRIRAAVQGPGTDEEAIYASLLPFRRDTLTLQRIYQMDYDEDLRDRLEDEMSGDELAYALDLMETPFERYMQGAATWLKRFPQVGFGLPWSQDGWFDSRFWRREYDPGKEEWKLVLSAGRPHQAIDAMFHEQDRWHVDCAVFVEVVQLYAWRQSLGATRFDERIGGRMELRAHHSTGIRKRALFKRESPKAAFAVDGVAVPEKLASADDLLAQAPVGSRVRWTSQMLFDKANNLYGPEVFTIGQQSWPSYQHENTIKLGPDRYGAHGVGGAARESRAGIEEKLADVTAGVFPDRPEVEIRAGIYVSEIELFEQPETAGQVEPAAASAEKGPQP